MSKKYAKSGKNDSRHTAGGTPATQSACGSDEARPSRGVRQLGGPGFVRAVSRAPAAATKRDPPWACGNWEGPGHAATGRARLRPGRLQSSCGRDEARPSQSVRRRPGGRTKKGAASGMRRTRPRRRFRQRATLPRATPAVPSPMRPFTAVFGMGTGVSFSPWSPENGCPAWAGKGKSTVFGQGNALRAPGTWEVPRS